MIDYATLCRAIDAWKSGQAPQPLTESRPASPAVAADDRESDGGYAQPEPADRTIVYAMPEMMEGDGEGEPEAEAEEDADMVADADEETSEEDIEM